MKDSKKSLTSKAFLNSIASLLDFITRMGVSLFINPVLLSGLGDYLYGVWQVIIRSMTYVSAASGQPAQALKISIASHPLSGSTEEKQQMITSSLYIWLSIFLPIVAILGAILIWLSPQLLKAPPEWEIEIRIALGVLVINLAFAALAGIPRAILQGENLGYKRMGISAALVILGGLLAVGAIYANTNLIGVAIAATLSSIITGLVFLRLVIKHVTWFGIKAPTREGSFAFARLSGWFILWQFLEHLLLSGDVVFLGVINSAEAVSKYTLSKFLGVVILSLGVIVIGSVIPGLGRLLGSGDNAKIAKIREEMIALTYLSIAAIGGTFLAWNRSFVGLWAGEEYFIGITETLALGMLISQLCFLRIDANIIDLTKNLKTKVIIALISQILSFAVAYFFMTSLSLEILGLCIGFILGRLLITIAYPYLLAKLLELPFSSLMQPYARPFIGIVVVFLPATLISSEVYIDSWLTLMGLMAATLLTFGLLGFMVGLSKFQRVNLIKRITQILGIR